MVYFVRTYRAGRFACNPILLGYATCLIEAGQRYLAYLSAQTDHSRSGSPNLSPFFRLPSQLTHWFLIQRNLSRGDNKNCWEFFSERSHSSISIVCERKERLLDVFIFLPAGMLLHTLRYNLWLINIISWVLKKKSHHIVRVNFTGYHCSSVQQFSYQMSQKGLLP